LATKQTLDRLSSRIDALAVSVGVQSGLVIIEVPSSMNEAAVVEQHCKYYPRDRQANTVIVRRFCETGPDDYRADEDRRISRAWRELAREQRRAQ